MAEKDLIGGFDPLAWMDDTDETDEVKQQLVDSKVEVPVPISEESVVEADVESNVDKVVEIETEPVKDNKLTLEATLNIQNVSDLYDQLLVLLENQEKIEIDASAVESIDTTTLQVLTILKRTAIKTYKEVIFDFPSDKFIESAELLGLAEMLEVDQAAAGLF